VVLHHDGSDVTPTVAFASADLPPVLVLNQADHQFWLGSSVADLAVSLRSAAVPHTAARRYIENNAVLAIPLELSAPVTDRVAARRAIGASADQVVLLSIGREEKYRPCGALDFIKTAGQILDRIPQAHAYIVGVTEQGIKRFARSRIHERLHFVGSTEDPSQYRASADIYIESFPFGSNTALLEAAAAGLPVVPACAPLFSLLVAQNDSLADLLPNPASPGEYIDRVVWLSQNPEAARRFGAEIQSRVRSQHLGDGWQRQLEQLYERVDGLRHSPRSIPVSECEFTDADVGLSVWHAARSAVLPDDIDLNTATLRHKAVAAKYAGEFSSACSSALRAAIRAPGDWKLWRLLGVTAYRGASSLIRSPEG
jgi:hypothetical protein